MGSENIMFKRNISEGWNCSFSLYPRNIYSAWQKGHKSKWIFFIEVHPIFISAPTPYFWNCWLHCCGRHLNAQPSHTQKKYRQLAIAGKLCVNVKNRWNNKIPSLFPDWGCSSHRSREDGCEAKFCHQVSRIIVRLFFAQWLRARDGWKWDLWGGMEVSLEMCPWQNEWDTTNAYHTQTLLTILKGNSWINRIFPLFKPTLLDSFFFSSSSSVSLYIEIPLNSPGCVVKIFATPSSMSAWIFQHFSIPWVKFSCDEEVPSTIQFHPTI